MFTGLVKGADTMTMEEVHILLGHIAPSSIRQMLLDRSITGITLNKNESTMGACKSCEYGKMVQKPTGKVRDPARYGTLDDEVYITL